MGLIPGWQDPLEEEMANPLQHSCLGNSMDRLAWWATIHGGAKSWTQLKQLSMHALLITYYMLQVYSIVIYNFKVMFHL